MNAYPSLALLFGCVGFASGLAMLFGIANYILGPISRAGGILNAPTKFCLMDFVCLVLHFQVVFAVCASFDLQNRVGLGILLTLMVGITLGMWAGGVSCASKAGIIHPWRRAVLVLCLLPFTLAAMVAIPFFVIITIPLIVNGPFLDAFGLIAIISVLGILCWKMRDASNWVLRGSAYYESLVGKELRHQTVDPFSRSDGFVSGRALAPGSSTQIAVKPVASAIPLIPGEDGDPSDTPPDKSVRLTKDLATRPESKTD